MGYEFLGKYILFGWWVLSGLNKKSIGYWDMWFWVIGIVWLLEWVIIYGIWMIYWLRFGCGRMEMLVRFFILKR